MSDFIITAKTNPKIKEYRQLLLQARLRREMGAFPIEGVRLCFDALSAGCEIRSVFYTAECREKFPEKTEELLCAAKQSFEISGEVAAALSDTVTPQGIFCIVGMAEHSFSYRQGGKYILLDTVQNPDNLGAIMRTAEALGIDGLTACGGCDIYNQKALRASMGAVFRLPVRLGGDIFAEIEQSEKAGNMTYAAVPDRSALDICTLDFSAGAAVIIGNEGNGVRPEVIERCTPVTAKMKGRAESLNAAAAAAIVMWELVK